MTRRPRRREVPPNVLTVDGGQIDWNKVAHDPILAQEITNGHAARMRYSRFRASMLGLEPQRRNRAGAVPKSKVAKSKKEPKTKKEAAVKPDHAPGSPSLGDMMPKPALSPQVKQEISQTAAGPRLSLASPAVPDHTHFQARLLTPCSDTDLLGTPQAFAPSPASDMLHAETPFDFAGAAHCAHDHTASWSHGGAYQAFGMPYELEDYAAGFCEHHHQHSHPQEAHDHHHQADGLCVPSALMEPGPGHLPVKDEEWDAQYHEI